MPLNRLVIQQSLGRVKLQRQRHLTVELVNRPMTGITQPDTRLQLLGRVLLFEPGPAVHFARNQMMEGQLGSSLAEPALLSIRFSMHGLLARESEAVWYRRKAVTHFNQITLEIQKSLVFPPRWVGTASEQSFAHHALR